MKKEEEECVVRIIFFCLFVISICIFEKLTFSVSILFSFSFVWIQKGLSMQVVRFRFDGQAINENDTPTSLEMEEGDTIEVYQQQTGGAQ